VYTFARAGELAALEWSDVDLDHGTIHIHRSTDRTRGRTTTTKTDAARRIPIERALIPLLAAMHREAKGRGAVLHMPSTGKQSAKLRAFLERVGVTRADLFTSDATRKALTFHDLRATGITWCAMRGDDPLKIMQRAGHADFETTRIYLREAENLSAGFGTAFPALPSELLSKPVRGRGVSASVSAFGVAAFVKPWRKAVDSVGATGFEPATPWPPER
jgi:integrase